MITTSVFLCCAAALNAEEAVDDFGFDSEAESDSAFSIDIGGKLSLGGSFYFNDFKTFKDVQPGSLVEGKLHVHATAPMTEAYFGVKLNGKTLAPLLGKTQAVFPEESQIAPWIDEVYLKMLFSSVVITGGIQKMNWGRADDLSVLDIVNPRDKTDLALMYAPQEMKIARPLISATVYLPYDLKLEGVYLPVFEGNRIVTGKTDRWYSQQFDRIVQTDPSFFTRAIDTVKTNTLAYSQGGGRLTAFNIFPVGCRSLRLKPFPLQPLSASIIPITISVSTTVSDSAPYRSVRNLPQISPPIYRAIILPYITRRLHGISVRSIPHPSALP